MEKDVEISITKSQIKKEKYQIQSYSIPFNNYYKKYKPGKLQDHSLISQLRLIRFILHRYFQHKCKHSKFPNKNKCVLDAKKITIIVPLFPFPNQFELICDRPGYTRDQPIPFKENINQKTHKSCTSLIIKYPVTIIIHPRKN